MNKDFMILPNPDFVYRKQIEENIKNNNGYCVSVLKQNDDTKCVCKDFKEQEFGGVCKCGQFYKILKTQKICLCGDLTAKATILRIARKLALEGYIVFTSLLYFYSENIESMTPDEQYLREIHKAEIAEADVIYVIYSNKVELSEFTKREIAWATQLGKKIVYLDKGY